MRKIKTWKDNLNDVVRDVFFTDTELLDYMLIPQSDRENIIKFQENYFVKDPDPDELITKEQVRVCYGDKEGTSIGKNALKKYLVFDVYVKKEHVHDVSNDMLASRLDYICEKIKEDLTDKKYVCRIDFSYVDDFPLYTKMIGYMRHRIMFSYKITF